MEIKGKIIQVLDLASGTSKAGNPWKKQDYVLETFDAYPKKVQFDFFGDKVDQYPLSIGETVVLSFDIESREFNGRWYTSIRGWKVEKVTEGGTPQMAGSDMPPVPAADFGAPTGDSDDLPF